MYNEKFTIKNKITGVAQKDSKEVLFSFID